jgi:hypothetical protein
MKLSTPYQSPSSAKMPNVKYVETLKKSNIEFYILLFIQVRKNLDWSRSGLVCLLLAKSQTLFFTEKNRSKSDLNINLVSLHISPVSKAAPGLVCLVLAKKSNLIFAPRKTAASLNSKINLVSLHICHLSRAAPGVLSIKIEHEKVQCLQMMKFKNVLKINFLITFQTSIQD